MKPTHWLNTVWLLLLAATGFTLTPVDIEKHQPM